MSEEDIERRLKHIHEQTQASIEEFEENMKYLLQNPDLSEESRRWIMEQQVLFRQRMRESAEKSVAALRKHYGE